MSGHHNQKSNDQDIQTEHDDRRHAEDTVECYPGEQRTQQAHDHHANRGVSDDWRDQYVAQDEVVKALHHRPEIPDGFSISSAASAILPPTSCSSGVLLPRSADATCRSTPVLPCTNACLIAARSGANGRPWAASSWSNPSHTR